MSYASRKGYSAERAVELLVREHVPTSYRPRAGQLHDVGDISGIPLVISVKNHARLELSTWVTQLERMVGHAGVDTGVVWHKRAGIAHPDGWYVTTSGRLFVPLMLAYMGVFK